MDYKNGNLKARNEIFERNLCYVKEIVEEYKGLGLPDEDLYQSAYEGLLIAIEKHNENTKRAFSMKVKDQINNSILRALFNQKGMSYNSKNKEEITTISIIKKILPLIDKLKSKLDRTPSVKELANVLDIDEEKINNALRDWNLVELLNTQELDQIESDNQARSTEQDLFLKDALNDIKSTLNGHITPKERQVLVLIYYHNLPKIKIAELLGISDTYVAYLESKAISRLKHLQICKLNEIDLSEYLEIIEKCSEEPIHRLTKVNR